MNKYIFKAIKSDSSGQEDFYSAINCARGCIESVLENDKLQIEVDGDKIIISSVNNDEIATPSASDCKNMIKGCFCDKDGCVYPEFSRIEPQQ